MEINLNDFWSPYEGAVSITFDDGTKNQLEMAIPPMDKLGLKGTFYVHPHGNEWQTRLQPWKQVALNGHEIGNHSLSHICSNNIIEKSGGLEDITLEDIEHDIVEAQNRLQQIAPHQNDWTYAYPCYCTDVGRGLNRQSYIPVIAKHFIAGRAGGEYGFGNHPAHVDLACTWGIATNRMSGFEMIGLVEELINQKKWIILTFHEINGPRLTVGSYDFQLLLDYLHRNSKRIWTAPVVEIAQKIYSHFYQNENKF